MSLNIEINATAIMVTPNGQSYRVTEVFGCLQTPSEVSIRIMDVFNNDGDPIEEYIKWVKDMEEKCDVVEEIIDWDTWDETTDYYKVVGTRPSTFHADHIESLREFVKKYKELGFDINVCMG